MHRPRPFPPRRPVPCLRRYRCRCRAVFPVADFPAVGCSEACRVEACRAGSRAAGRRAACRRCRWGHPRRLRRQPSCPPRRPRSHARRQQPRRRKTRTKRSTTSPPGRKSICVRYGRPNRLSMSTNGRLAPALPLLPDVLSELQRTLKPAHEAAVAQRRDTRQREESRAREQQDHRGRELTVRGVADVLRGAAELRSACGRRLPSRRRRRARSSRRRRGCRPRRSRASAGP